MPGRFAMSTGRPLMGVKLIVEILDHWQDAGLTAGERADLLVLAENANDVSRETFGPVHEEYILKRAGKKAAAWRVAIAVLKRKGVLEYAIKDGRELAGRPGQHAVYRIPVLCPDPPHDGYKGMCTRPKRVSSQLTHPESNTDRMGEPSANPSTGAGYPTATERVSPDLTPTPPSPSTTSPLTPAERVVRAAAVVTVEEEREFIAWITATHNVRGPGWWKTVARNGDLPDLAATWRADKPRPSPAAGPKCDECDQDGLRYRFKPDGNPIAYRCPCRLPNAA